MKRFLKILAWSILSIIVLLVALAMVFMYKVKHGFPVSYETEIPTIDFPAGKKAVLLFSKSTGFRHAESIDAGKAAFRNLAQTHDWFLYDTEEGGVFNPEQLTKFDAVIFNNSTGRLLNDEQQQALENYVETGGKLIGIHGAGDNSHHWEWYVANLTGSDFSHHAMDPHLQSADIRLQHPADSAITPGLPDAFTHADEWYVFYENPRTKGFHVLYAIDGEQIISNGNMLWIKDKNFGMGKDHPVAWYRETKKGKTFYTSIGHDATAWQQEPFIQMLVNAVNW